MEDLWYYAGVIPFNGDMQLAVLQGYRDKWLGLCHKNIDIVFLGICSSIFLGNTVPYGCVHIVYYGY